MKSETSEEEAKVIREVLSLAKPETKNGACSTNSSNAMIYAELFASKLGCDVSLLTGCVRDLSLALHHPARQTTRYLLGQWRHLYQGCEMASPIARR